MSGDNPEPVPDLSEIVGPSGILFPNPVPYTHVTFALVAWNEEDRLPALLRRVRPFFSRIVVGVQESDDDTLAVARELADVVVEDQHWGFGDKTFGPKVLPEVKSRWTLKVDADEWPSDDLLESLSSATWYAENEAKTRGVWIPFRSSVEGIEYEEQHAHLRLFESASGWPALLHSRPPIQDGVLWQTGHIRHDRSLNELVADYLRYLEIGKANPQWTAHNRMMIRSAVRGTAEIKGWGYVKERNWWDDVKEIVE